ncbi:unannotated protein [freshwater metagenome]|uniref:Unannotated protein n=1 Tax=freshwater metagenome TaxID=449393 RepID=A0A6J7INU2_9ZZZZ|nr:hydantoinase/oxoprolinase family protein [Actinomycetota bacterium]
MLLGVDVGGTFTDAVLVTPTGIVTAKAPTTPHDQSLGVMAAIDAVLAQAGATPDAVQVVAHGMTVATNALLEDVHARTAFVATEGFADLIELGRQARPELYRLCVAAPAPIAPPQRRFGVRERQGPRDTELALTPIAAAEVAERVAACAPDAVAVCLLHSWRDPTHERLIGDALRERLGSGVHLALSHEIVGTFREYERAATTEIDAALSPLLGAYLERLLERTAAAGLPDPQIMQSSGGLVDAHTAGRHAALTVLSGPAGGAAAAALIAAATDRPNLLCFDMGGTSCDVCVIEGGRARETAGGKIAGRPVALPMVDIHTVGAGGGSIAWRDAGGALRVGPRSAGADPGPAAYGRGGTEPTVTDAHVVLGRLRAQRPLAGGVRIDEEAAHAAVGRLAQELGLELDVCAAGILRVANAEMVRALRVMTVERGLDPRDFALLAFGGAGPLHAAAIAEELGMDTILIPRTSGVLSALGLAAADREVHRQRSVLLTDDALSDSALDAIATELLDEGRAILGAPHAAPRVAWDLRYRGQSHELTVDVQQPSADALRAAFEDAHEARYGWREAGAQVELVTVRVAAVEPGSGLTLERGARGETVRGPTILHLPETTVTVPAGWHGTGDGSGTLVLERER